MVCLKRYDLQETLRDEKMGKTFNQLRSLISNLGERIKDY